MSFVFYYDGALPHYHIYKKTNPMLRRIQNVSIYKNMDINLLKHIFEHVHILESQFQAGQTSEQTCPVRRSMRQPQGEDTTN